MSTLYIVGTPIGNLEDISLRAIRVLKEADLVLCEDTRVTAKLLNHHGIDTKTVSYHQHSGLSKLNYILNLLKQGKNLALVSDSGTPGISDPGGKLVQQVRQEFGDEVKIESVPGPSAVTAALSISGVPADKFLFLGFPPHKKGRQKFLKRIVAEDHPVVVYESKHRIVKFLQELKLLLEEEPALKDKNSASLVVCRELSKMHETVYRGDVDEIIAKIDKKGGAGSQKDQKGEFAIIVY